MANNANGLFFAIRRTTNELRSRHCAANCEYVYAETTFAKSASHGPNGAISLQPQPGPGASHYLSARANNITLALFFACDYQTREPSPTGAPYCSIRSYFLCTFSYRTSLIDHLPLQPNSDVDVACAIYGEVTVFYTCTLCCAITPEIYISPGASQYLILQRQVIFIMIQNSILV